MKKKLNPYPFPKSFISERDDSFRKYNDLILNTILENINDKELIHTNGRENIIYYFSTKSSVIIDYFRLNLPKGEYILKHELHSKEDINKLLLASEFNLLPKIYFVNNEYIINKFINAIDLEKLMIKGITDKLGKFLYKEIERKIKYWHSLNLYHGDLNLRNILLNQNYEIFLIDPDFSLSKKSALEDDLSSLKNLRRFLIFDTFRKWDL